MNTSSSVGQSVKRSDDDGGIGRQRSGTSFFSIVFVTSLRDIGRPLVFDLVFSEFHDCANKVIFGTKIIAVNNLDVAVHDRDKLR